METCKRFTRTPTMGHDGEWNWTIRHYCHKPAGHERTDDMCAVHFPLYGVMRFHWNTMEVDDGD